METAQGNIANERCGWASDLPVLQGASLDEVVSTLVMYVRDSTPEQIRAWKSSVQRLQQQSAKVLQENPCSARYGAILEFTMPDGPHRVDAVLLVGGAVLVIELKGDGTWQPGYMEQASDYARRLFWYHSLCGEAGVRVHTILASYGHRVDQTAEEWCTRTNVDGLADVIRRFDRSPDPEPIDIRRFIDPSTCQPSASLVSAARRFFANHALPHIKRIDAITDAALTCALAEIRSAHSSRTRKLILISGVPGAGKTFVGLKIAHEEFLDELAEPREGGERPTAPAVFLSGNGPLVEVLQYELRRAGGEGRAFVRGVKEFVERYSRKRSTVPPHHVFVFDEAQRAWDEQKVRAAHKDDKAVSEPEAFIDFAARVPRWSVVVGLIGQGQEIHSGEEGGMELWARAIAGNSSGWEVVGPRHLSPAFAIAKIPFREVGELHLSRSVRFHFAEGLSDWASALIGPKPDVTVLAPLAAKLRDQGYQIRVTRNLTRAKEFLWSKYQHSPDARFGLAISSRDKCISSEDVAGTKARFFRPGPWYADPEESPNSCRRLSEAITWIPKLKVHRSVRSEEPLEFG